MNKTDKVTALKGFMFWWGRQTIRVIAASILSAQWRTYGILVTKGITISSRLEVSNEPPWGSELTGRTTGEFGAAREVVKREFWGEITACGKGRSWDREWLVWAAGRHSLWVERSKEKNKVVAVGRRQTISDLINYFKETGRDGRILGRRVTRLDFSIRKTPMLRPSEKGGLGIKPATGGVGLHQFNS